MAHALQHFFVAMGRFCHDVIVLNACRLPMYCLLTLLMSPERQKMQVYGLVD